MKVNTKKYSFKALAIVLALMFTVLFIPVGELAAWARIAEEYADFSYMTIGTESEKVSTTVNMGATYTIANAYIGGSSSLRIGAIEGTPQLGTVGDDRQAVTLVRSDVTVTYGTGNSTSEPIAITEIDGGNGGYGTFVAADKGTYTITYSYVYRIGDKDYYNYYDMTVESVLSTVNINLEDNDERLFPTIIDLSQFEKDTGGNITKDFDIPVPTITGENGDEIEGFEIIVDEADIYNSETDGALEEGEEKNQLLVSIVGGHSSLNVNEGETKYLSLDGDNLPVLDGAVFNDSQYRYSDYTITYRFYHNGNFVTTLEKASTTVYESLYENYTASNLKIEPTEQFATSVQPGVEQTLPGITVTTSSGMNRQNVSNVVDVFYKLKVQYKTSAGGTYKDLDKTLYNGDDTTTEDDVLDERGYLIDVEHFTPLQEGYYTFIYEVYDIYSDLAGDPVKFTTAGQHEWRNIRDTQSPTAVVYDASVRKNDEPTYEDASSKLKTNAYPNGVIIYAVGVDDNIATPTTATLRRVVYANSNELFTIEDYDAYNLIFNYKATSTTTTDAYQNFINNNYLIRKDLIAKGLITTSEDDTDTVNSDQTLLDEYLKENYYLIVIDKGNYSEIFRYFQDVFTTIEGVTDAESMLAWISEKEADNKTLAHMDEMVELGFAFIDTEKTFGASSNNGGFNFTTYEIRYFASDVAGNSNYTPRSISLRTTDDLDAPVLSLTTTFQDTYLPETVVTFEAPTATDPSNTNNNYDSSSRMTVRTFYRLLGEKGVLEVKDGDDVLSIHDMEDIFNDLSTQQDRTDSNGIEYVNLYSGYHTAGTDNDGYVELTDSSLSEFSIDLSKVEGVTKVQIFAYAYDDAGNVGVIGREFNVANAIDSDVPNFKPANGVEMPEEAIYEQNADVELPTITIRDDLVDYVSYKINISHVNTDGTRTRISNPLNSTSYFDTKNYSYTVNGGTFVAPFSGDYSVATAMRDSANNTIVVFSHYTVASTIIVQDPVIRTTLESQTVQIDDNPVINIPTPTVDYSIDNSVDYDTYMANTDALSPDYVVVGVDENGYATDYSVANSQKYSFTPTAEDVGSTVKLYYEVRLQVYNPSEVTYHEGSYSDAISDEVFGTDYFTIVEGDGATRIKTVDENTLKIRYTDNNVYYAVKDEDGTVSAYTEANYLAGNLTGTDVSDTILASLDLLSLFTNVRMFKLTSDIYNITVQDTQGPVIDEFDYGTRTISQAQLDAGYSLTIQGLRGKAHDASGIDYERSTITVTTEYQENGQTYNPSQTLSETEVLNGKVMTLTRNGTITIRYTVYDNNGNSSSQEVVIRAGDVTKPSVNVVGIDEEDFIKSSYALSDFEDGLFTINLEYLDFEDPGTDKNDLKVEYSLVNKDTTDEEEGTITPETEVEGKSITYRITETGTYTFTVTVTDPSGNFYPREFEFTVTDEAPDATMVYQIVGTVLIVISVLVLAGVIIYFVVSKVKLDKELKK